MSRRKIQRRWLRWRRWTAAVYRQRDNVPLTPTMRRAQGALARAVGLGVIFYRPPDRRRR